MLYERRKPEGAHGGDRFIPPFALPFRGRLEHIPRVMRPLLLLLCLSLPACGNLHNLAVKAKQNRQREKALKNPPPAVSPDAARQVVGEVMGVRDGYVLVQALNGAPLTANQELECRGAGPGSARLKVTPARMKNLYAADILSGTPAEGDAVITVKGNAKTTPRLVPVMANALPGSSAPANTVVLDPSAITQDDLPKTNLEPIPLPPMPPRPGPRQAETKDAGNLLLSPPPAQPALPQ